LEKEGKQPSNYPLRKRKKRGVNAGRLQADHGGGEKKKGLIWTGRGGRKGKKLRPRSARWGTKLLPRVRSRVAKKKKGKKKKGSIDNRFEQGIPGFGEEKRGRKGFRSPSGGEGKKERKGKRSGFPPPKKKPEKKNKRGPTEHSSQTGYEKESQLAGMVEWGIKRERGEPGSRATRRGKKGGIFPIPGGGERVI